MKRKLLLLALCLLSAISLKAQAQSYDSIYIAKQLKIQQDKEKLLETRHQFRVGFGFDNLNLTLSLIDQVTSATKVYQNINPWNFNLEYSYRVVDFLEVGAYVGFTNSSYDSYDYEMYEFQFHREVMNFTFGVIARYSWFNRKVVSLYSSAGVWYLQQFDSYSEVKDPDAKDDNIYMVLPEVTPIGVRVGGRLFGYFEPFSIGGRGWLINFGIGYKF